LRSVSVLLSLDSQQLLLVYSFIRTEAVCDFERRGYLLP
jgi:hypothetical protein